MNLENITSDTQLVACYDQLEAELSYSSDAFHLEPSEENRLRFKNAQIEMRNARFFWRSIGEYFGTRGLLSISEEN